MPYEGLRAQEPETKRAETSSEGGQNEEARRAFAEAVELFAAQNYVAALRQFERSYELSPRTVVLFNIAMCNRALDDSVRAAELLVRYLNARSDSSPWRRAKAQEVLEEIDRQVVRIELAVGEAEATLLIDSTPQGTTPLTGPVRMLPGTHEVRIEKDGFEPFVTSVDGKAGDQLNLEAKLQPLKSAQALPPAPAHPASDSLNPEPSHQPLLRQPDVRHQKTVIVGTSSALLGVATLALALGTAFAVVRENADVEETKAAWLALDSTKLEEAKSDAKAHEAVAYASFVVGGVLVTTAIAIIAAHRHRGKKSKERTRLEAKVFGSIE
jgi:tetratricopeptide (TPR) repeat protein